VLTTRVHGYQQVVVSNFLQDRYPFLEEPGDKENREVFQEERGLVGGVHKCVFFRRVGAMLQVLTHPNSTGPQVREALLILNETVSVQEEKSKMIEAGLVEVGFGLLDETNELVCLEALSLLGSLLSVREGRMRLPEVEFKYVTSLLTAGSLRLRENVGWMLTRIASGRDGVGHLIAKKMLKPILMSLTSTAGRAKDASEAASLSYLLQTTLEILRDDHNIVQFTGHGFPEHLNKLLLAVAGSSQVFGKRSDDIAFLSLECLSLFVIDNRAKSEAVAAGTVEAVESYLHHSNSLVINSAIRVLMFVAIDPAGRARIIEYPNQALLRRFKALHGLIDQNIRENLMELIATLSEDVLRFRDIFNSIEEPRL